MFHHTCLPLTDRHPGPATATESPARFPPREPAEGEGRALPAARRGGTEAETNNRLDQENCPKRGFGQRNRGPFTKESHRYGRDPAHTVSAM